MFHYGNWKVGNPETCRLYILRGRLGENINNTVGCEGPGIPKWTWIRHTEQQRKASSCSLFLVPEKNQTEAKSIISCQRIRFSLPCFLIKGDGVIVGKMKLGRSVRAESILWLYMILRRDSTYHLEWAPYWSFQCPYVGHGDFHSFIKIFSVDNISKKSWTSLWSCFTLKWSPRGLGCYEYCI